MTASIPRSTYAGVDSQIVLGQERDDHFLNLSTGKRQWYMSILTRTLPPVLLYVSLITMLGEKKLMKSLDQCRP